MATPLLRINFLRFFKIVSLGLIVFIAAVGVWLFQLNRSINTRVSAGWFRPPVELYARGERLRLRQNLAPDKFAQQLRALHFRERFEEQALYPNDFARLSAAQCEEVLAQPFSGDTDTCIYLRTLEQNYGPHRMGQTLLVAFKNDGTITGVYEGNPLEEVGAVELQPLLFAQFYGGEPILRNIMRIGDAPVECLQAVTAIEDSKFLEHRGFSITGFLRALGQNILSGRYAQGGSTITQQLVKNYFLTSEKTLTRKATEIAMSLLLETHANKDQILANYLNVVYMGQRGPFQVIGFSAASDYYLNKPLSTLRLPECALLAAIINSPGRYNPFTKPENALQRRNFVLDRMVETDMIAPADAEAAKNTALPKSPDLRLAEPAPYFSQAVFRELAKLGLDSEGGLRVFTTLDELAQDLAQKHVLAHVEGLEKSHKAVAALKAEGKNIESSLISVDILTGEILALVGGRQYSKTQYNRILDAHRQVGSIMKPFVFLAALESFDSNGDRYTPLTIVRDEKFVHKYEGQSWSPRNYTKEFYGAVPLFYALKNSLNAATAKVGLQVGLENIVEVAERAGITSSVQPLPSLTLGAFEIYPLEMATAMLTLARWGERVPLTLIRSVEDLGGSTLFVSTPEPTREFAPEKVAVLVGMMKQTLRTGTARLAKTQGFTIPAAGKTGTTSDTKDTWFAGFTPHVLTLTWAGYDDNTPSTLTGASGALPLWLRFMKAYAPKYPTDDFSWPEGAKKFKISPREYKDLVPFAEAYELEEPTELIRN